MPARRVTSEVKGPEQLMLNRKQCGLTVRY